MRLINVHDYSFGEFFTDPIPKYSILSHTWDKDEVKFQEMQQLDDCTQQKQGFKKIRFACEQSIRDGLQWTWVDTCCIDKINNAELAETINSMFRWYRDAARCYVYLSDVSTVSTTNHERERDTGPSTPPWESAFRASRWFTRGWTLQELIAPTSVQFFTSDGILLGDKISLLQQIHEVTGIAIPALRGAPLAGFTVEERFKWVGKRRTTREEDSAYSLLGIFGVFIAPIYGEGKANAIRRLRKEIYDTLPRSEGQRLETFLVPYPRNDAFIGRTAILGKLQELPIKSASQARVSLFGLGGIGKTQIALEYVYWIQETYPDVSVFWVHASSVERFRQTYISIAEECRVPGYDDHKTDVLALVKRWLEGKDCGWWIMVVDNADDTQLFSQPGGLGQYIPECAHGSIVVTTRNKEVGVRLTQGRHPIEVGKMDESESEQLLQEKLKGEDFTLTDLSILSSRLEYLPLALVQAAAFIRENTISADDYLRLLDKGDQDLIALLSEEFQTVGRDSETPRAVAETWILSFEQIQQQNSFAGELLSLMSFFDRQAIPMEFLSHYNEQQPDPERREEIQFTKALGVLKAFCFVIVAKDQTLDVHRLVQLVTRKWLAREKRMNTFARQALLAVSHAYPSSDYENWAVCGAYLPHVYAVLNFEGIGSRDEVVGRATLLHQTAAYLHSQGQWEEAERLQLEAVQLRREVLGTDHPDTLKSMAALALTYNRRGQYEEAEKLQIQVMDICKAKLGTDHSYTLSIIVDLGSTYQSLGRYEEAEKLQVQVMETLKMKYGVDHPDTLSSMHHLGSTYRSRGRYDEAAQLQMQVVEIRKTKFGADHPDTLNSMAHLASTLWDQGENERAEKLQVQVLETQKAKLGADHPDTLNSMAYLASMLWSRGQYEETEKLQVQVMETRKTKLGADHPDTLNSMTHLGSTYQNRDRYEEAEKLQVRVMETLKMKYGIDHPDTLSSMSHLGLTYWNQRRYDEAAKLQMQMIEIRKTKLGADHPRTLNSMSHLALTLRGQGQYEEAEKLQVQVLETQKAKLGADHPNTLNSMAYLASTLWHQSKYEEAEKLGVQVMETRKAKLGPDHPSTLASMHNLAYTWKYQGRHADALALMKDCALSQQRVIGQEHPNTQSSLAVLDEWNS